MGFKLDKNAVLLVALGVLALALVFFSWVLQLPSQNPVPVAPQPPATGVVAVNVVGGASPSPSLNPDEETPCSGLPEELTQECLNSVEAASASSTEPQPCDGLPDELKTACLQSMENQPAASDGFSPSEAVPCDGLPEELKQQCLSSIG